MTAYAHLKINIPHVEPSPVHDRRDFEFPHEISSSGCLGANPDVQIVYANDERERGSLTEKTGRFQISASRGGRRFQEDTFSVIPKIGDVSRTFCGVFDGHGRPSGSGLRCSHFCATKLTEMFQNLEPSWDNDIKGNFKKSFAEIDQQYLSQNKYGGSTASCAYISNKKIWTANTGDSRVVLCDKGKAIDLTDDHSPCREDEKKRIEDAGGIVLCVSGVWRVDGSISISRSFGDKHLKDKDLLTAEPEIKGPIPITKDHEFLIIATDGIWNVMSSQDAVDIVRTAIANGKHASDELIASAVERSCSDNMCVIIVSLRHYLAEYLKPPQNQPNPMGMHLPTPRYTPSKNKLW